MVVKSPAFQKDRNSCVHVKYIMKFWTNLCVTLQNKYFKKLKDGEDGEPEKKSCPEGNQPKDNETEKTEGIQCKKSQRLKEKEENWENNNKFMILKKRNWTEMG